MSSISKYESAPGYRWRVRYRKPDGTQTDKRGFKTKREAEIFSASIAISKSRGEYIDPEAGKTTIGELAIDWLSSRTHLKPSTTRVETTAWRVQVKPKWENRAISSIKPSEIQTWLSKLNTTHSATIVRRAHGILASILDSAVADGLIMKNVARGISLPKKTPKPRVYLTLNQVVELSKHTTNQTLILFLAFTGLRWGEVTALRIKHVDNTRRRVIVEQNAVVVGREILLGTTKTEERRSVPYPKFLAPVINDLCERDKEELLFTDNGDYLHRPATTIANKYSWWTKAIKESGVPAITIHDLRHTAASLAISSGANVKSVQRMLGHKSATMTLDTYADLFEDDLDAVADSLNEAFNKNVGKMWANDPQRQQNPK